MSNPLVHAERSARKWGGVADDYLALHQWFDATKGHLSDVRHRLILHNSFGILLAEQVFCAALTNSDGRRVFVRDIGTQHVLEDLGFVPTLSQCLAEAPCQPWMAGAHRLIRTGISIPEGSTPIVLDRTASVVETVS
jgi:hypothetical protein